MYDIAFNNPFLIFFIGSFLLYYSSDLLILNSIILSDHFNVPRFLVGGTIIALGTSLPEITVSVLANLKGNSGVAVGNIVGSNIANIGLVLGVSLFFKSININKNNYEYLFNTIALLLITIMFYLFLLNGSILFIHGLLFLLFYFMYFLIHMKYFKNEFGTSVSNINIKYSLMKIVLGLVMIYFGSKLFIDGALGIAYRIGIDDIAIGLTIVALGTSAPELIVSMNAIKKNESMLAIGNIFGSNIANIVFAAGISSFVKHIYIDSSEIFLFGTIMLCLTILLSLIILLSKKIYKIYSLIFTGVYVIFIYINFNSF